MRSMLTRVSLPVLLLSLAIISVGLVVKELMPDPKEVSFSGLAYDGEIPGHTKVSDVTVTTEPAGQDVVPAFPGNIDVVQATFTFTVQRKDNKGMEIRLIDDRDRIFTGETDSCMPVAKTLPFECSATLLLPADALGSMTFQMIVSPQFGGGVHQQPLPMPKRIEIPVEVR